MAQLTAAQAEYRDYLHSPRWRLIRWIRRRLDGNMCRCCPATTHLQTHHRRYDNKGRGFWAEVRDCVTLCDSCHEAIHGKGRK